MNNLCWNKRNAALMFDCTKSGVSGRKHLWPWILTRFKTNWTITIVQSKKIFSHHLWFTLFVVQSKMIFSHHLWFNLFVVQSKMIFSHHLCFHLYVVQSKMIFSHHLWFNLFVVQSMCSPEMLKILENTTLNGSIWWAIFQ